MLAGAVLAGCSTPVGGSAQESPISATASGSASLSNSVSAPDSTVASLTGMSIPLPPLTPVSPTPTATISSPSPSPGPTPTPTPTRTPPTTTTTTTATTGSEPTPANDYITPCPSVDLRIPSTMTTCLSASVSDFWSSELNQVTAEKVVVSPDPSAVPAACRPGLTQAPAFTCNVDETLYVTSGLVSLISKYFTGSDVVYAYATLLAHEIGHVVQQAVDQPGYGTAAQSQMIEQQADCLSGVWAAHEVVQGKLDGAAFVDVSRRLITLVSSNAEIFTHGTPAVRAAAVAAGLAGGRPQTCHLATFS